MYTGGNKAEQIEEYKKEIAHLEYVVAHPEEFPGLDYLPPDVNQRFRVNCLRKKKRKLGRLEKQLRH